MLVLIRVELPIKQNLMTLIEMMFLLMVVKSDEDVDGYGDGDRGDSPSRQAR